MPKGSEITLGYVHDWHRVERRNEWIDAVISQKSRNASKIKDNFDAITISGGFDLKTEERSRHTVWMENAVWQRVQEHYKRDGCSTQNELVAKAIPFYCGYLQSEYAGDFLPKILGETLEAILSMFGDRIGKLLLKQAVEKNVCNHILASDTDIDAETYQKMGGMSYQEVLRTNGQISFPEVLRQQKRL